MNPDRPRSTLNQDRHWPPRDQLPRTITIERVPFLGTSWYERRTGYWLRRVGLSFIFAFIGGCIAAIDWGVVAVFPVGTARQIALAVLLAYVIATGAYVFVSGQKQRLARPKRTSSAASRRASHLGASLGILARSGFVIGQIFIVLSSVLGGGVLLAFFVGSFLPEIDNERWARNALADQLDEEARIIERNRQRQARRQATIQRTSDDHT